jgi:y4mF family transcriptional regulator
MSLTPEELGRRIKKERKALGLTQAELALTSGTGMRFISDLENGKPTCQIGKTLIVLKTLGLRLTVSPPDRA